MTARAWAIPIQRIQGKTAEDADNADGLLRMERELQMPEGVAARQPNRHIHCSGGDFPLAWLAMPGGGQPNCLSGKENIMAKTGADILLDTIWDWGVDVIFGLPGDGINGIMESLRVRQERIRFIQVRHEEAAAFMACAYAKYTGRLGVCLATSGPGGVHLLNGLYDAKMDGQPVLAITGHHFHDLIDTHSQQDIDLDRVFSDVAVYSTRVMGPAHVANVADLACRKALTMRGVSHINFPVDFQSQTAEERSKRNIPHHTSDVPAYQAGLPPDDDLRAAAAILNEGKKVVILAGRGSIGASDRVGTARRRC